jgi:Ca2+-binding EF-hand superfamily protein
LLEECSLTPHEIDLFYAAFRDIDADASGTIRWDEMSAFFNMEITDFNKKIFNFFDKNEAGFINFLEFTGGYKVGLSSCIDIILSNKLMLFLLVTLWNFLTM